MTRFIDGSKRSEPKKIKKTVFTHIINSSMKIESTSVDVSICDNVQFLFNDDSYGDVFIVWNDDNDNNKTIMFGTKGDEDYG